MWLQTVKVIVDKGESKFLLISKREKNLKQQWFIKVKRGDIQLIQHVSCLLFRLKFRLEKDAISAGPEETFLPHPTTPHPPKIQAPSKNEN